MGKDVSYHPLDLRFIHERLVPYVSEGASIDDLVEAGTALEQVRARAKHWSLAVLRRAPSG